MKMTLLSTALYYIILLVSADKGFSSINGRESSSKMAYVTVHYEGTSRDAEYVLGIQVLMQSLAITSPHTDRVILASETVSKETRQLFQSIGCRVISVNNIENPFVSSTLLNPNFQFTLNKLHVWNLIEYERVVYLDADNIALRNTDDLFSCGHFCAVYMNPCHFHTGVLAITPSTAEYKRLLSELTRVGSFDGADQGFLSSVYGAHLKSSPLFIPKDSVASASGYRLPIGYNINHKYYYEQYHWNLFHLRQFRDMVFNRSPSSVIVPSAHDIPATTLGFPMAPSLKPWYYWSVIIMDLNWVWQDVRSLALRDTEFYGISSVVSSIKYILFILTTATLVLKYGLQKVVGTESLRSVALMTGRDDNLGGFGIRMVLVVLSFIITSRAINPLTKASYALTMLVLLQHVVLGWISMILSCYVTTGYLVATPYVSTTYKFWLRIVSSVVASYCILYSTWGFAYPNILWKMSWTVMFVGCEFYYQGRIIALAAAEHRLLTKRYRHDSHLA